jgi:O-antigen ligase
VRERIEITTETTGTFYRVQTAGNLDASTGVRVVFARIGFDMFMRSPIWGNGLDSFHFRTAEFGAKYGVLAAGDAHNLAVGLAAETGLIGLFALAWIIWAVFRCGRRLWRSDSPEYLLGAVLLAAATHDLVANLSSTAFLHVPQVAAQFWILYALSARACEERFAVQEAPAARAVQAARWRRFADRSPVRVPQS